MDSKATVGKESEDSNTPLPQLRLRHVPWLIGRGEVTNHEKSDSDNEEIDRGEGVGMIRLVPIIPCRRQPLQHADIMMPFAVYPIGTAERIVRVNLPVQPVRFTESTLFRSQFAFVGPGRM